MRYLDSSRLIVALVACMPAVAAAEKPVESNVDNRLTLAFRASEGELAKWLPASWHVSPIPGGPSKDANLFIIFVQRLLSQTPDGKPSATGGTDRAVALAVPAKNGQTGQQGVFVTRIYTPHVAGLPGPYKNSVQADVRRELVLKGESLSPGTASDVWEMKVASGGTMSLRLEYQRSVPARAQIESKPRSAVDAGFYRIYRVDQGVELVKSTPAGVDRVQSYEFRSTVPELAKLLDDAQLVSITALPWYVRQVLLPVAH